MINPSRETEVQRGKAVTGVYQGSKSRTEVGKE